MYLRPGFYIINALSTGLIPPAVVTSPREMAAIAQQHEGNIWFATYDLVVKDFRVVCQSSFGPEEPIHFFPSRNWILFLYMPEE